jgi:hypothetical protein
MTNLTYEAYVTNPEIRSQLEREARHARSEAVHGYIAECARQLSSRKPAPQLQSA